ncbi:tumor necrosis factor alpha-induced protein 2-like, partial [Polyodon spathula]|uniref:tumor necrosis factor alpha-induced protein 2-like n=1 Tax=Polyodon spathula TaxID=7913 RepID=UPI001B7E297D
MPVLKNLSGKLRGSKHSRNLGTPPTAPRALILGTMDGGANPFEEEGGEGRANPFEEEEGGGANPFEEEEGGESPSTPCPNPLKDEERSSPLRGTLDRIRGVSSLKTLGKLGKGLRSSIRGKGTPGEEKTPSRSSEKDTRKSSPRSSEELTSILSRLPGNGKPSTPEREGEEGNPKRKLSFLKIGLGGKIRREAQAEKLSLEREGERVEEEREGEKEEEKKVREPLSVLEIMRLVMKRDLFVADTHILELERECEREGGAGGGDGGVAEEAGGQGRDSGRKLKDVELLYEALLKELGEVVRESLLPNSPAPPPALPLLLQVIEQEERADREWAEREAGGPEGLSRPRQLRRKWKESVAESASSRLPCRGDAVALAGFLGALSERVVQDLCTVKRNTLPCYPPEYEAFAVHLQSYHQAVGQRLREAAAAELDITELHTLLDWVHNTYCREVLDHSAFKELTSRSQLSPLLPLDTLSKLERDYISFVKETVTGELSQDLEAEERRWGESLQIEEYQSSLASNVIAKLQIHLDRASGITAELGARVAHCCLSGLADFLQSFQKKVEAFLQYQTESGSLAEGFTPKTIALVNCCPPFRSFLQRCAQCETLDCEDGLRRGVAALDRIVSLGVKVLVEQLFQQIKPYFEKLVNRKWLNNTEAFDSITRTIRSHFKTFCRMEGPPYQALVCEVHRRVLVEYLHALMHGRIICTSAKKRRKMSGRLRDEGRQIKELFRELDSGSSWLDSAIPHVSEIIVLEDTPSIQMEVGVLVSEYPDVRKKHIAALLDLRGMLHQVERTEILNILKDLESSLQPLPRDRALFSELAVTSEARCLNLGLSRVTITTSSLLTLLRERAGRGRGRGRGESSSERGERGERR